MELGGFSIMPEVRYVGFSFKRYVFSELTKVLCKEVKAQFQPLLIVSFA